MKTVIALIAFSNGELSMFKGEIRDIDETKAEQLISEGYVKLYSAGGNIEIANVSFLHDAEHDYWTAECDKTFEELISFKEEGKVILGKCVDDAGAVCDPTFLNYLEDDAEGSFVGSSQISDAHEVLDISFYIDLDGCHIEETYRWVKTPANS
jgi:hypothetical protein